MVRSAIHLIKAAVLPHGKGCRRLPLGIARGIRLDIDFAVQTKMFLGLYEVELNKYVRRLCEPGFNCFDVGAQFGYDALLFAKLSKGRVASFECDPITYQQLSHNIARNTELRDHIELIQGYVTSNTQSVTRGITLDDVAFGGRSFVPDFIKMDIEGGELEALVGARRILEERHPNLLIETHSRELEAECLDFVSSIGYTTLIVEARKWLTDHRPTEHNRWFIGTHASKSMRSGNWNLPIAPRSSR